MKDVINSQEKDDSTKESDKENMNDREYQEWIWSLKRVSSVIDVDGKEYGLSFLPFLIE